MGPKASNAICAFKLRVERRGIDEGWASTLPKREILKPSLPKRESSPRSVPALAKTSCLCGRLTAKSELTAEVFAPTLVEVLPVALDTNADIFGAEPPHYCDVTACRNR